MSWRASHLGSVATLQRGFDLPSRLRRHGTVPIVSSSGISGWHDRAVVSAPGVVTGRYGTIGEVFFQDIDFWPLNTTLWVSNFHGNDERFIFYLLQRVDYATHSGKSGVPGVNRNDLHTEIVTIPISVAEQKRISQAIDAADDLIATLKRLIAKKLAIKQGLMQQLLTGYARLPGFRGGWQKDVIGKLCSMRTGTPKKKVEGGRHWIVDMGSVTRDAQLVVTRKTNDGSDVLCAGELVMPKDDIGGGNIIGRTGLIEQDHMYVLADHVYALTPRDIDSAFLNLAINSHTVNASLRSKVTGSAQLGLSRQSVLDQVVSYPREIEEQRAIAVVVADIQLEIRALQVRLTKARAIKTGMMQQLLTGRARLPAEVSS